MATDIDEGIEDLLTGEPLVAHLATCRDGRPHIAPLWYVYRDGAVEVVTTGRKLDDIRQNGRVAPAVQKNVDGDLQWGLTLLGDRNCPHRRGGEPGCPAAHQSSVRRRRRHMGRKHCGPHRRRLGESLAVLTGRCGLPCRPPNDRDGAVTGSPRGPAVRR